jgi:methylase of polypeptide subunit release factors
VSTEHVLGISAASTSLALAMARLTSALNEVAYEVRDGSLQEPVAGERFDLIVSNPPSVVSPGTDDPLVYRDSGLPGDEVVRRVVSQSSHHLNEAGWCQVLANWAHRRGEDWQERVERWIPGDCDAWVLQRERVDLPT